MHWLLVAGLAGAQERQEEVSPLAVKEVNVLTFGERESVGGSSTTESVYFWPIGIRKPDGEVVGRHIRFQAGKAKVTISADGVRSLFDRIDVCLAHNFAAAPFGHDECVAADGDGRGEIKVTVFTGDTTNGDTGKPAPTVTDPEDIRIMWTVDERYGPDAASRMSVDDLSELREGVSKMLATLDAM